MNFVKDKADRKNKIKKKTIIKKDYESIDKTHSDKLKYFEHLQSEILPKKIKELEKCKGDKKVLIDYINDIKLKKEETEYFLYTIQILEKYWLLPDDTDYQIKIDLIKDYYNAINMDLPSIYHKELNTKPVFKEYNCTSCSQQNCILKLTEGFTCSLCGVTDKTVVYSDTLSFDENMGHDFETVVDYKRINYFSDMLNQIQAKENIDIKNNVIDKIIIELNIEKFKDLSKLDKNTCRRILKKIGESKYYEHIPYIIYLINGIKPKVLSNITIEKLKYMFTALQTPYEMFKDNDRKSSFSYQYCFYKLFEILDIKEYLVNFTLLRNREKLSKHDEVFKKVIEYLKTNKSDDDLYDIPWKFYPTI